MTLKTNMLYEEFHVDTSFDKEEELSATFWEHIEALRKTLINVVLIIVLGVSLCLFFYSSLLHLILNPLNFAQSHHHLSVYETRHQRIVNHSQHDQTYAPPNDFTLLQHSPDVQLTPSSTLILPQGSYIEISSPQGANSLALLGPLEGMRTTFKICFWTGVVLASPIWLFVVAQFIAPAFGKKQKLLFFPFLILSLLFLGIGAFFAWKISLPLANEMFYAFNQEIGTNLWSFAHYIDYSFLLILANALAFEIALISFFFVHVGILSYQFMREKRRLAILFAFILAALLTPPDVFTQVMLAMPLIVLYELALLYARFKEH